MNPFIGMSQVEDAYELSEDSSPSDEPCLEAAYDEEDCNEQENHMEIPVFINFRELLWYWREYYLRRGRDRLSLEFSSQIPFKYWKRVSGKFIFIFFIGCYEIYKYDMICMYYVRCIMP